MAIKARWKGKGPDDVDLEYLNGIPARSLDEDEYDALDTDQKKLVRESPLYDVRTEREAPAHSAHRPASADKAEADSKG